MPISAGFVGNWLTGGKERMKSERTKSREPVPSRAKRWASGLANSMRTLQTLRVSPSFITASAGADSGWLSAKGTLKVIVGQITNHCLLTGLRNQLTISPKLHRRVGKVINCS